MVCSFIELTIPSSVKSIESEAFKNCSLLREISIQNSVVSIGESAFSDCSTLVDFVIPPSITAIEDSPSLWSHSGAAVSFLRTASVVGCCLRLEEVFVT